MEWNWNEKRLQFIKNLLVTNLSKEFASIQSNQ
jgi:hypothetical protein